MMSNKLKSFLILIAACCIASSLWAEVQGADEGKDQRGESSAAVRYVAPKEDVRSFSEEEVPTGSIMAFAGAVAPQGWLLCDGKQESSLEYPELYRVIGEKYAPEDEKPFLIKRNMAAKFEKTFYLPDLIGRVIVGVDERGVRVTSNNTLGEFGGEQVHQLSVDELAPHHHLLKTIKGSCASGINEFQVPHLDDQAHRFDQHHNSGISGKGHPHNNMQPYQVLNYIISTGKRNNRHNDQIIDRLQQQISDLNLRLANLSVQDPRGCAKAWVCFDGSANIFESYGVSSVTKHAVGNYTVNFLQPFKSENYCSALNVRGRNDNGTLTAASDFRFPQTRDNFRILVFYFNRGDHQDASIVSACFYGSQ
ncbi:MAG: 19, gp19 [Gammaproteobacteria bacterium]|jgi:microcystin-dependent protein|nr:19, gp19 [Gammaproteobacteria bacterium]